MSLAEVETILGQPPTYARHTLDYVDAEQEMTESEYFLEDQEVYVWRGRSLRIDVGFSHLDGKGEKVCIANSHSTPESLENLLWRLKRQWRR
jgi:hypothetical protein